MNNIKKIVDELTERLGNDYEIKSVESNGYRVEVKLLTYVPDSWSDKTKQVSK